MKLLGIALAASLPLLAIQAFAADMPKNRRVSGLNRTTYNYCRGSSKYRCEHDNNYGWGSNDYTYISCNGANDQQIIASRCGGNGGIEYIKYGAPGGMCGFDWFYVHCN